MGEQLTIFENATVKKQQNQVVNVASVPQRSPFRYPGGKTWLIPTVRDWLRQDNNKKNLIEPFAVVSIYRLAVHCAKPSASALMRSHLRMRA